MLQQNSSSIFDESMAQRAHMSGLNGQWKSALHYATCLKFPKNAVIPHSTKPGVYYLAKGEVVLTYCSSCGRERTALYYEEGSLFNEARTFSGYNPDGIFTCTTDVEAYLFSRDCILNTEFIRSYPELIRSLLASMGAKILLHYSFLADMGTGSHIVHICRLILSLSQKNGNSLRFSAEMTQQEVAALLGVHRTTLARILRRLISMGVISKFTNREVCIENRELLLQLAEKQA